MQDKIENGASVIRPHVQAENHGCGVWGYERGRCGDSGRVALGTSLKWMACWTAPDFVVGGEIQMVRGSTRQTLKSEIHLLVQKVLTEKLIYLEFVTGRVPR